LRGRGEVAWASHLHEERERGYLSPDNIDMVYYVLENFNEIWRIPMNNAISSLAWIKVIWDENPNIDYVDQFVPFIVMLISKQGYDKVDLATICADFENEFGLIIPFHPMTSILKRMKKRGYFLKLSDGRYRVKNDKIADDDFESMMKEQQQNYDNVINTFIEFCERNYLQKIMKKEAERILIAFLKKHDLEILFAANSDSALPDVKTSSKGDFLINSFIKYLYEQGDKTFSFIVDISIGHSVVNALLYERIEKFEGKFRGLNVYLDTAFLFNIFEINGKFKSEAYREFIKILREHQASLFVFRHTYKEFRGILESCWQIMRSGQAIDYEKASRALRYFLDNRFTISDVEQIINNIDAELDRQKIVIVSTPPATHDHQYQIDEHALEEAIVSTYKARQPEFDEKEKEYTIYQDIKSISAIYKLRKGRLPNSLRQARHIFVTTNASLAYACNQFERQHNSRDSFSIPAALTDVFVGTLLWIYSPVSIETLNQKKLVASCYAALRPQRTLVRAFVDTVERLQTRGEISSEDALLLKASRTARILLQEKTLGDQTMFSAEITHEILDEIKNEIRSDALKEVSQYRTIADKERQKREEAELALQKEKEAKEKLLKSLKRITNLAAKLVSGIFWLLFLVLLSILFIPDVWGVEGKPIRVGAGIVSVLSLFVNFQVNKLRDAVYHKLEEWLYRELSS